MFQNFESTKKHLTELAEIINKFKSEAVQLRLVELLFNSDDTSNDSSNSNGSTPTAPKSKAKRRTKAKVSKQPTDEATSKKKTSPGGGAVATLVKIFGEGYFKQPKSISDICSHCEINMGRRIKPNEISGKLVRMVRSRELSRTKNTDNQYVYKNA